MTSNDQPPPVADDDFPEFAEPPKHKPRPEPEQERQAAAAASGDSRQEQVDDVIARLRRERAEGKR